MVVKETRDTLVSEMARIIRVIRTKYSRPDGLVVDRVDGITGEIVSDAPIYTDLGDYVQNVAYAGNITGRHDWIYWAIDQVKTAAAKFQTPHGFFTHKKYGIVRLEDNQDTFMGIMSLYRLTKDPSLLTIGLKLANYIVSRQKEKFKGNVLFYTPFKYKTLPLRVPCGVFAEELAFMHKNYLSYAKEIIYKWIDWSVDIITKGSFFIPLHFVLPAVATTATYWSVLIELFHITPLRDKIHEYPMIKTNTNMVSAALEVYRMTRDKKVLLFIEGALAFMSGMLPREDGFFFGVYDFHNQKVRKGRNPLADNHHILNVFLDAYVYISHPSYLRIAEKTAEFWLSTQGKTGLFPEMKENFNPDAALLDSNVDFIICLLKLYSITKKEKYFTIAKDTCRAVMKQFSAPNGMVWSVNCDSGHVYKHKIYTKYLGLYVKLLTVMHETLQGKDIYRDRQLFDIGRDR